MNPVRAFSADNRDGLWVTKSAKLVVHTCRGKIVKSEGIKLPDGKPDQESGFLEADEVQQK